MSLLTGAFHLFSKIVGFCLSKGQGLEQEGAQDSGALE